MKKFDHILVANRGEIATRIMRTARELGYRTTAIYSEADADSPHVQFADDAIMIGPAAPSESYLNIERILGAVSESGAQAIHPGYGFLSENADFAKACQDMGVVFVGPEPGAIDLMGNKAKAKRLILDAGVPCVPGYQDEDQSEEVLVKVAADIGYPIMVKAVDGGGGRGMRLVEHENDLPTALSVARSEAMGAFGSSELILEKAIVCPRHVEIQVLADTHGNTIHLGERDCSVQRRHQKIVEEAPCPSIDDDTRQAMAASAIDVVRAINYTGAGTVEFLVDESGDYYFIEMNTRLQVEHGVTEMITGLDLVAMQIQVAQGDTLPLTQADVTIKGHAIEARVYAEDPDRDFLPSSGLVHLWQTPEGDGVRVDNGIQTSQTISPYYDSMVAKIVTWAETRDNARLKLIRALQRTVLFGPKSNLSFLIDCLETPSFAAGTPTTSLIEEEIESSQASGSSEDFQTLAIAAALQYRQDAMASLANSIAVSSSLRNWSSCGALNNHVQYTYGEEKADLHISTSGGELYTVSGEQNTVTIEVAGVEGCSASVHVSGRNIPVVFVITPKEDIYLVADRVTQHYTKVSKNAQLNGAGAGDINILAPMHGCVLELFVREGDVIDKGDRVAVLEAMKMQHVLQTREKAVVEKVLVVEGAQVASNAVLIELAPTDVP